jgi:hypothetical protein
MPTKIPLEFRVDPFNNKNSSLVYSIGIPPKSDLKNRLYG